MKLKDVTILVETHRGSNTGRTRLHRLFILSCRAFLGLFAAGALTFLVIFVTNLVDYRQLVELEYIDGRQQYELDVLDNRLDHLLVRVGELEPVNDNLRLYHGFRPSRLEAPGIGGPEIGAMLAAGEYFRVDLMHVGAVIARQRDQLNDLVTLNEQRVDYLSRIPSINPLPYSLNISGFAYRRCPITRRWEFHNGVDLVPRGNNKIVAAADGTVVVARHAGAYGLLVRIDHGYGYQTRYAHCRQIFVQPGDFVRRGEVIALVGATGRATGVHIHYEVLHEGINVDPEKYILADHEPINTNLTTPYFVPAPEEDDEGQELRLAEFYTTRVFEEDLLLDIGLLELQMNPALDDPLFSPFESDESFDD